MAERIISAVAKVDARRGADVLLEILESEGVQYIFGNPGTTELPFMDALLGAPELQYILALQEASAVAMADGYAQAARRPAFLNLHTAGGLGHGMGNLLNASVSQTPLVITAGQQDSRHTVTDPLLFGDLVQIASPAVKWAQEIASVDQLPILVRRAFHDASAAPTGPVFLSLPMNVMEEMSTISIGAPSRIERRAVAGSLDVLADLLAGIRPGKLAVIAGDEVYASNAAPEAVGLAEAFGAPVYGSSWPLHIPFPTSHPLWAGNLPTKASEIAETLKPYDAIFALGGKSLITILYTEASAVPPGCDVFQMSADVRDLGRTYATKLSVVGDIKASLDTLLPLLAQRLAGRAEAYAVVVRNCPAQSDGAACAPYRGSRCRVRCAAHRAGCRCTRDSTRDRPADRHRRRGAGHHVASARVPRQRIYPAVLVLPGRGARLGHAGICRLLTRSWSGAGRLSRRRRCGHVFATSALDGRA